MFWLPRNCLTYGGWKWKRGCRFFQQTTHGLSGPAEASLGRGGHSVCSLGVPGLYGTAELSHEKGVCSSPCLSLQCISEPAEASLGRGRCNFLVWLYRALHPCRIQSQKRGVLLSQHGPPRQVIGHLWKRGHRSPARLLFLFAPQETSSRRGVGHSFPRWASQGLCQPAKISCWLLWTGFPGPVRTCKGQPWKRGAHSHGSCGYMVLVLAGPGETIC